MADATKDRTPPRDSKDESYFRVPREIRKTGSVSTGESDVQILGGGVIGLACALQLLRRGRSVTVLEQARPGAGSSHGNCGTITPSHAMPLAMPGAIAQALGWMWQADAPLYVKPRMDLELARWFLAFAGRCNWKSFRRTTAVKGALLARSRKLLARLVKEEALDCEFQETGTLIAFRDPRAFERSAWMPEALKAIGMRIESFDGAEARRREPALNDSIVAAYFNPDDASLRPDRFVAELAARVRGAGGTIHEGITITDIERSGKRLVVRAGERRFTAGTTVMALGAWSPRFARALGMRLPIQPGKGYSITFDRPQPCPRLPLTLKERSICVTAWSGGYRLGSTMEFSGYDDSLNRTRLDALTRGAAEYLHAPVGPHRLEEWYGWRPMTYDDLPVIGRAPGHDDLVLATGHGMLGVTLAAVTAQLVAEIVLGEEPSLDIAPYSPARFA